MTGPRTTFLLAFGALFAVGGGAMIAAARRFARERRGAAVATAPAGDAGLLLYRVAGGILLAVGLGFVAAGAVSGGRAPIAGGITTAALSVGFVGYLVLEDDRRRSGDERGPE